MDWSLQRHVQLPVEDSNQVEESRKKWVSASLTSCWKTHCNKTFTTILHFPSVHLCNLLIADARDLIAETIREVTNILTDNRKNRTYKSNIMVKTNNNTKKDLHEGNAAERNSFMCLTAWKPAFPKMAAAPHTFQPGWPCWSEYAAETLSGFLSSTGCICLFQSYTTVKTVCQDKENNPCSWELVSQEAVMKP